MDKKLFELYDIYQRHPVVTTDSRKVPAGSVFFALKGDNFDGNAYAAGALEAGAAYAVVDDEKVATNGRYVLVKNVLEALQALARFHRRQLGIPVLAITGSNGKTTTKELVSRVLAKRFNITTTEGNLNNHIGVPLTLLSIVPGTELAVVEMGANHRGEIASYCAIAEPDYGLITNIGKAHLEGFGGEAGIRRGKGELFDYLARTGGTAFYPSEDAILSEMIAERPGLNAFSYSIDSLSVISGNDNLLSLQIGSYAIHTHLAGTYNRANVAAALAIGEFFEVDPTQAVEAIESYTPDNNRSQRITTERNILYLDAYNANPSSMEAALLNFSSIREAGYEPVLILGDMRELGEYAAQEHEKIISLIRSLGFSEVYGVGPEFSRITENRYPAFQTVAELVAFLESHPLTGRVILLKGSRGIGLEKIVPLL